MGKDLFLLTEYKQYIIKIHSLTTDFHSGSPEYKIDTHLELMLDARPWHHDDTTMQTRYTEMKWIVFV